VFRTAVLALSACIGVILVTPDVSRAGVVRDQFVPLQTGQDWAPAHSAIDRAQTFVAGRSGPLHHVTLQLITDPDCDVLPPTVALTTTIGGMPAETIATASVPYDAVAGGVEDQFGRSRAVVASSSRRSRS
jgi:hypothetical protein